MSTSILPVTPTTQATLPNVIYIGPDKAGSSWLFKLFANHPDIYVTPAKDLYFFDRYYNKGMDWYAKQFAGGYNHRLVSEISHDYLYDETAAQRMQQHVADAKLVICLREPVERTFSAYLHLVKSGHFKGTFEEALEAHPGIINRSLYGKHVRTLLNYFPKSQLYTAVFDDLKASGQRFADQMLDALDVPRVRLPEDVRQKSLPAGRSRSVRLTQSVRWMGNACRDLGMPGIVGRVKSSRLVQSMLFAPYSQEEKPRPAVEACKDIRRLFARDLELLDEVLDANFSTRWGYTPLATALAD